MIPPGPRPPRLSRWLLSRVLPPAVRTEILADLDEEFREHQAAARGPAGARRWYASQALRSLPHALALRLGAVGGSLMAGTGGDLRFAVRTFRVSPGVSGVVVGSLGVGIGVCILVWGVVDGVILHPFPYPEPDRLVAVVVQDREGDLDFIENVSAPEFLDIRRRSRTLERFYAFADTWNELATPSGTVSVWTTLGWGDPFTALGVEPWLGRGFLPHELEPRGADVMILSHRVWVRDFGADSSVVGREHELERTHRVVVGVMPPGVLFHDADVWRPAGSPPGRRARGPDRDFQVVARIRPGHDLDDADRELGAISAWMAAAHGGEHPEYRDRRLRAVTWTDAKVAAYRPVGLLLLGAAGLLLLLITVNVAGVLLARSAHRAREHAVRVALGAGRVRLVRQLLVEGVLLGLMGGALGTGAALLGLGGVGSVLASLGWIHGAPTVGWALLPFALVVSLGAGVIVSVIPALEASGRDVRRHLRTEGPGATASRAATARQHLLVATEVAVTVLVLAGGAVLGRALLEVARLDPGFDTSHLLTLRLSLPSSQYGVDEGRAFFVELERRVGELPGVRAAGVATTLHPGAWMRPVSVDGADRLEDVAVRYATPAYLAVLGVGLVHGEPGAFGPDPYAAPTALVNRAFAARHGGPAAVVGKTVRDAREDLGRPFRVVGVTDDLPNAGLLARPEPEVLLNHHQIRTHNSDMRLVARTEGPPLDALPAVREIVRDMDPRLPLLEVEALEDRLARSSAPLRLATLSLLLLSLCALVLSAVGVAGVVAFAAARRRREIGLRRALGAREAAVRREMTVRTLRPALLGAAAGAAAAVLAGGAAAPLLPPPAEPDPLLVLAVLPAVGVVAAVAAFLPSVRASRVDPTEVLK